MEHSQTKHSSGPLPLADRNSDLQRRSFTALHTYLPMDRFLVRDARGGEDYGVDALIELRDNGRVTNLFAQVQLKATDRTDRIHGDIVSLQVESANLNYLTNGLHSECALYILYLAVTDEFRFAWAAEERRRIEVLSPNWKQQSKVTLRFGSRTLSEPAALDEIYDRIASHNASTRSHNATSVVGATPLLLHDGWDGEEEEEDKGQIAGDPERLVDVGRRIKSVRKDLGLDLPQFARALSHPDLRALARIESGVDQSPMWLIRRLADLSGARADWIELGTPAPFPYRGRRYHVRSVELHRAPDKLAAILARKPKHLYLCLEPLSKQVIVLAEQTSHHWRTYDLCALDFWNWQGSRYQIPKVRAFLQGATDVQATLVNYSSCYLSPIATNRILSGDVHPKYTVQDAVQRARSRGNGRGRYWTEDFVDIYGEREGVHNTEADYGREYGEWFVVARELMREWDGAIHPFERMRTANTGEEATDGDTKDTGLRPFPKQQKTTNHLNPPNFSAADYGGPINLLPRRVRPQPWWRIGREAPHRQLF